jgi:hypothetical protein
MVSHDDGVLVSNRELVALNHSYMCYFIYLFVCSTQSVLAGESMGLMVGTVINDMEKSMTVLNVFSLFLVLLGGFFVQNIPVFVAWAICLLYDASLLLVFDEPVPCDGSAALGDLCGGASTGSASPEEVVNFLGVQGSVGFNVGLLSVLILVPRYIAE